MIHKNDNNTNINQGMIAGKTARENILKSEDKKIEDSKTLKLKDTFNGR